MFALQSISTQVRLEFEVSNMSVGCIEGIADFDVIIATAIIYPRDDFLVGYKYLASLWFDKECQKRYVYVETFYCSKPRTHAEVNDVDE